MRKEKMVGTIFNIVFGMWCFFDIVLRTAFEDKINTFLRHALWNDSIDINRWIDVSALVVLMAIIVFLQHYSYGELVAISIISIPVIVGTINADSYHLMSVVLFVIAAKYADMDKVVKTYFYILLIMIPFIIIMCFMGVLPDLTMHRGGQLRHALGFEHPNRLGMRFFQLVACYCYTKRENAHNMIKYILMCLATYFVYKVPNSQTAYIAIVILMIMIILGGIYDKYGISKRRLMELMAFGAGAANIVTVFASFYNPGRNRIYLLIDKFMSHRFMYGYKMYKYYGVSLLGQKVDTLVKDSKYVGVYHHWFLDNAYLSILLKYGIVVYIIFSVLLVITIVFYVKQENYTMVAILFTYSIYGIMTTGFYMMSHNIFLLTIASPLYSKARILDENVKRGRFRIVWG